MIVEILNLVKEFVNNKEVQVWKQSKDPNYYELKINEKVRNFNFIKHLPYFFSKKVKVDFVEYKD